MDTYADDLAALVEALDLRDAIHVGHSTGGGEVARYIGRHGTKRVAKAVLIGAVPPLMLKTPANPGGLPIEVFDGIRAGVARRSLAVLQGSERAVLRRQPSGREGVAGRCATRSGCRACRPGSRARHRLHQGVLGDRLHRGPEEDRRADADHARRRRSDRADRRLGDAVVEAGQRLDAQGLSGAPHGMCTSTRTRSTPICWRSSRRSRTIEGQ